jgi:hypothetical protein
MNSEKVISREYKLVLKTEKFTGDEFNLLKNAKVFWASLEKVIQPVAQTEQENLDTISLKREIRFYDTKNFTLHNNNYIFRERKNFSNNQKEVTLKFRHPDRYVSQDRNLKSRKISKRKMKLEEDIKAPFIKLYSFSSGGLIVVEKQFKKIKDIAKLYPGLATQLNKYSEDEEIFSVHDSAILEIVITGSKIIICNDPLINAECALIVWYNSKHIGSDPIIVEFSFRYGNKKEKYSQKASQKAYDLFLSIQKKMKSWIDIKNTTKTSFIYQTQ